MIQAFDKNRKCKICGKLLSMYNNKTECHSHSVPKGAYNSHIMGLGVFGSSKHSTYGMWRNAKMSD